MNRLQGKTALITGGTTGIGLETAKQFLAEGARVAITGTNPANLESARQELGDSVLALASNAGLVADQAALAQAIQQHFGHLDILVVNAGVAELRPLGAWDEAAFDRSFGINLKGPFFLIQALLPVFATGASIVFNGSVNAHIGMANTTVYAATKAGLISLARTISGELIPRAIRVNVVSPGPITTPLYSKFGLPADQLKAVAASIQAQVPIGRFGEPSEIAQAILFFASDETRFAVGSELMVDGGMGTL
jgi:NAD(P)-dependent dehydrogenase (short-subunit alcohol dehydrogenase family)